MRLGLTPRRVVGTICAVLLLGGLGAVARADGRPLRYVEMDFPWSYDPITAKDNAQKRVVQLLFGGITREVGKEKYAPDLYLATEETRLPYAPRESEGYEVVVSLRPGVRWLADADPRRADPEPRVLREVNFTDVIATLRAILNPNTRNHAYPELAQYVKVVGGDVDYSKIDRQHYKIQLIRPVGQAAPRLFSFKVLPASVLARSAGTVGPGSPIGQPKTMMCTGPYWLDQQLVKERSLVFKSYPEYHGGPPRIREVRMSFVPDPVLIAIELEAHQADLAPEIPYSAVEHLLDQPEKFTGRDYASFNYLYVGGNRSAANGLKRKYINDIGFRQALDLATSAATRQEMITKGYKGEGAPLRDFFGANAPYRSLALPAEPTEAERAARIHELLKACGYAAQPVTFELKYRDTTGRSAEAMADIFVENANRYGISMIKVGVRTSKARDLWAYEIKRKRHFDFILDTYAYGGGYDLEPFFHGRGDANVLGYRPKDDRLYAAFAEFRRLKSPTDHWNDLRQIVKLLLQDRAVICIGSLKTTSIWRKDLRVPAEKITSEYFFNDIQQWRWN